MFSSFFYSGCHWDLLLCNKESTSCLGSAKLVCNQFPFLSTRHLLLFIPQILWKCTPVIEACLGQLLLPVTPCPEIPPARLQEPSPGHSGNRRTTWTPQRPAGLCATLRDKNYCFFAVSASNKAQHVSHICAWPDAWTTTDKVSPSTEPLYDLCKI